MKELHFSSFFVCILLLGLSGCTMPTALNQNKVNTDFMDIWIGRHISGVIGRRGPATQITDDEAGGRIYIWVEHHQKTVRQPYTIDPPKQQTPTSKQTATSGEMRWNPLFNRWEYESETKTTYPEKSFSDRLLEMQTRTKYRKETVTTTGRVMFYTRADGTIYHWLIITPNNNHYASKPGNVKKDTHSYSNRSFTKEEKRQYSDEIRKYNSTIYLFPDDAKAYFNRGIAKYELGLTREAKQDLRTALRLATQQGKVKLKNNIEKTLRDLQ